MGSKSKTPKKSKVVEPPPPAPSSEEEQEKGHESEDSMDPDPAPASTKKSTKKRKADKVTEHAANVSSLPFKATEDDVRAFFAKCDDGAGPTAVDVPLDVAGRSTGRAKVVFATAKGLEDALELDGEMFGYSDRWVKVRPTHTTKPDGCTKVFIWNLSFNVTEEDIKQLFSDCGTITEVHLSKDLDTGKPRGNGRVEFKETEATDKAIELNGSEVLGRAVHVDYDVGKDRAKKSRRDNGDFLFVPAIKPEGCTTVYVGNLSFDADEDAIKGALAKCGKVQGVRLLKHRDSDKPKGMAFVDFAATESTDEAIKLTGTELLGRPMMISYAKGKDESGGGVRFGGPRRRNFGGRPRAAGRGRAGFGGRRS